MIDIIPASATKMIAIESSGSVSNPAGKVVFYTKDDANGVTMYPDIPSRSEYDPWKVTEDLYFGKVIETDFK